MKKAEAPGCMEAGSMRSIRDDSLPNRCEINQKRIDAEWTSWQGTLIDTVEEWKRFSSRNCANFSHGGIETCLGNSENIVEWLKWVNTRSNWAVSRLHCEQIGGKLFDDLNGTSAQLQFMYYKLHDLCLHIGYWVGVTRTTVSDPWMYLNGTPIAEERLLWLDGEPLNTETETAIQASVGLNDAPPDTHELCAVCDMI